MEFKGKKMSRRYNHWFWNSKFMIWFSQQVAYFNAWLWHKMYGRGYANNFWHAVDHAMDKRK